MSQKILTVSNAAIDMWLRLTRLPAPGETLSEDSPYCFLPGGRGVQVAMAIARLQTESAFCTRLGADSHGKRLLQLFEDLSVDTRFIGIDKIQNTGFSAILTEQNGSMRRVNYPGANRNISRGDIEEAFLSCPDALVLQTEIPFSLTAYSAKMAEDRGIPVFLDLTSHENAQDLDRLPTLTTVFANEVATQFITGIAPVGADACLRAALELSRRVKARFYVLKLGARGAYVYDGRFCHMVPAYPVRKIVDTAGVGDAFTAAYVTAFLNNGGSEVESCRYGNAAAALTLAKPGTVTAFPTADEVTAFIKTNPNP